MTEKSTHLKNIKIEGFKSIATLNLPMESINILIGANGAGKTNFISLFTFLRNLSQGKLKNHVESEGGSERFFHFGSRHTSKIKIEVDIGNNGYHVELSPNYDDDSFMFDVEFCTVASSHKNWHLSPIKGESGFFFNGADSDYVKRYTKEYLEQCHVYHFHDTSKQASFKKTQKLSSSHYLENDAANIAPFLFSLKNSKSNEYRQAYQQIVIAIQSVAPFFHDFYLEPTGEEDKNIILRWVHTKHDAPFSANVLSDGTARFICLVTLFLQPELHRPKTIIIDEPELGLHPAALNILADIIKVTAKHTQIICSTQSVAFANFFSVKDFIVVDAKDGVSCFRRLTTDQSLENWLEDYGMGDIWCKNLIGGRPEW
ncbi:MAG: AAA family ATPase [Methylococcaceae bacterium]|nr:AAA family ATPase [Methylococcaceae bacterium]